MPRGSCSLLVPCAESDLLRTVWRDWPQADHADAEVSAHDWEQRTVLLFDAGAARFGNHVCLPSVCCKQTGAKHKFCRMLFRCWTKLDARSKRSCRRSQWSSQSAFPVAAAPGTIDDRPAAAELCSSCWVCR